MLFYYVLEQSEGYIFLIFFQGQPIQLGTSYKVDTEFIFQIVGTDFMIEFKISLFGFFVD